MSSHCSEALCAVCQALYDLSKLPLLLSVKLFCASKGRRRNLQADSLVYFIKALIYGSHRGGAKATSAFGEMSAIFCLEMLTTVTLLNQDRIIFVWYVPGNQASLRPYSLFRTSS